MPDIDKAWETVRAKYLPRFVGMARKHGAIAVTPFSQANMLKAVDPNSTGWCYGLSLGYLLSIGNPFVPDDFIADAHVSAAISANLDPSKVGKYGSFTGFTQDVHGYQNYWPSQYQTEGELKKIGLTTREWDKVFDDTFYRFTKVAAYIADAPAETFFLIKSPNHAMAASSRITKLGSPAGWRFFDPNFGEVVFGSASDFKEFFVAWFDQDKIQKSYKGSRGGQRGAPPASSLVLTLCAFERG
jgi:hypothetical protein